MDLSASNQRVLDAIVAFKSRHDGTAPTLRELAAETGLASTNTVHVHLQRLEELGYIERDPLLSRVIRVVGGRWLPPAHSPNVSAENGRAFDRK